MSLTSVAACPQLVPDGEGAAAARARVTISDEQVTLSRRHVEARSLAGSIERIKGDFCALPPDLGHVDLAFSIEALVHAPSGDDYFRECARQIRPGGMLVACDDFITDARFAHGHRASRWIDRFRRGWIASNLGTEHEANERGRRAPASRTSRRSTSRPISRCGGLATTPPTCSCAPSAGYPSTAAIG